MRAIDTNVVVRYLTGDDPVQAPKARAAVDAGPVFASTTALLESEWVLRSVYGFSAIEVAQALRDFAGLPGSRWRIRVEADIRVPVRGEVAPPGHVVARLRAEPDHRRRHALGIDEIAARVRRLARNHRGVRRTARDDHVHGDPGAAELAGMARGHRLETGR